MQTEISSKKTDKYGFIKVASANFLTHVGAPDINVQSMITQINEAHEQKAQIIVFPELSITGYTCADMFSKWGFLDASEEALSTLLATTSQLEILICIGAPLSDHGQLYNCAIWIYKGDILGVIPKTYIPNYNEFYEKRWFVSSTCRRTDFITVLGQEVPFNENLMIRVSDEIVIGTEICEDLWVDAPPSGLLSRAGATIIANPSASPDTIGKRTYRRDLVSLQSARCRGAYIYSSSGAGESSTDLVFSGHCIIADNGTVLCENADVYEDKTLIYGIIDVERAVHDRRQFNSEPWVGGHSFPEVKIEMEASNILPEYVDPYPFVPSKEDNLQERCEEILSIQVRGLMQRLRAIKATQVVIGISGGLDSTLALLVACTAFDKLGLDRAGIVAITMPGFGTSNRTKRIADSLMEQLKVTYKCIDIKDSCIKHMSDIEHPLDQYDVTYENVQARERTQILFDYANKIGGIVIGTGDMSELALGWCTYNGDHMSNYAVNSGVPKTLVKYLVRSYALGTDEALRKTLMEVFDLPISPELLPTDEDGNIAQKTEDSIGKYDLHDFFMYHYMRNGESKKKILALAKIAYPQISDEELASTLDTFFARFRTQQFKRSCIPDGVKIGSVAISPRGDLRLPSDLYAIY